MRRFLLLAVLVTALGCASSGKTDRPALIVPSPPARVIEPAQEPPVPEPVAEIPATPPATSAPPATRTGRGTRDVSAKPPGGDAKPDAKPESKPETTAEANPPAPPPPVTPPPQLRTAESTGAAEKTIRATVDRARQLLSGVDYRRLNNELRKAYNDSKKFADQADEALKQGNVALAQAVAAKAETLAKELSVRR